MGLFSCKEMVKYDKMAMPERSEDMILQKKAANICNIFRFWFVSIYREDQKAVRSYQEEQDAACDKTIYYPA